MNENENNNKIIGQKDNKGATNSFNGADLWFFSWQMGPEGVGL